MAPSFRLAGRLFAALAFVTVATAAGAELYARRARLDLLQYDSMRVDDNLVAPSPALVDAGVEFLPRGFVQDEAGFTTGFGRCDLDWPGRTLLALGDSTTVQTAVDGVPQAHAGTWPLLAAQALGDDWQACVLAENGYHPSDLVALWQGMALDLQPDHVALLLCENDLVPQKPRQLARRGGETLLLSRPNHDIVWRQLWNPWLYARSEAYRHLTWRMALRTGDQAALATYVPGRDHVGALRRLVSALDPQLLYLPPLVAGPVDRTRLDPLAAALDRPIAVVDLGDDPQRYRLEPEDTVHVDAAGHRRIARQVVQAVQGAASP